MNKPKTDKGGIDTQTVDATEWSKTDWKSIEKRVFKLQKRIYQASQRGEVAKVRKLQKTLLRSYCAKLLAVRKITQDNTGKKTAGVDGVKSLTPKQRCELAKQLDYRNKPKPTRRVWIPKPGRNEKRPLGIPTIADRATQTLAKLALEPEWEAHFEPHSFGFRPGRSAFDVREAIYNNLHGKHKYVLDTDIEKCFDRINHQYLLRKIKTFPTLNKTIKAWLRAGVIDGREFQSTNEGTPQGGAISPLLANIALHGIEEFITAKFPYKSICKRTNGIKRGYNFRSPVTIRYADDLVVIHESKEVVERCKELLEEWLEPIGLKLKESKTRIVHTSKGFDFLGYNFRIYSAGKTKSDKDSYGRMLGHITIIKPSNNALKEHIQSLRETIRYYKTGKQEALINALNKIIRGWTNYHKINSASKTFSKLNHLLFLMLKSWASRRSKGGKKKMMRKYWRTLA